LPIRRLLYLGAYSSPHGLARLAYIGGSLVTRTAPRMSPLLLSFERRHSPVRSPSGKGNNPLAGRSSRCGAFRAESDLYLGRFSAWQACGTSPIALPRKAAYMAHRLL